MSFLAPVAAILTGVSALTGMFKKDKPQQAQALPPVPTVASAADTAADQLAKKRRTSMLRGGNTDITRGTGSVLNANVGQKELVGA